MADTDAVSRTLCSTCLEPFKNPKILQCFHTFCAHCLKDIIKNKRKVGSFECPLCRTSITIPKTGVDGFQNNFYIQDQVTDDVKLLCNGRRGDEHKFHETRLSLINGETYNMVLSCCHYGVLTRQCLVRVIDSAPNICQAPKLKKKPVGTSVFLTWERPTENGSSSITKYRVKMSTAGEEYEEVYTGNNMFCELDNLTPAKKYLFSIQALNGVGSGPWSEPLEVTLDPCPPGKPQNVAFEEISSKYVTLTWTEADDNGEIIRGYVIKYNAEGDMLPVFVSIDNTVLKHVVDNLKPGTKYSFQVYAVNTIGDGNLSKKLTCQTIPEKQLQLESKEMQRYHSKNTEEMQLYHSKYTKQLRRRISRNKKYNKQKVSANWMLENRYPTTVLTGNSRSRVHNDEHNLLCVSIALIVLAYSVFYSFWLHEYNFNGIHRTKQSFHEWITAWMKYNR